MIKKEKDPGLINLVEWFLHKEVMSHKKIQKMCYYAQAWSLVINEEDIVPGITFEAWVHGPVNPVIYKVCKPYGWREIAVKPNMIEESKEEIDFVFSDNKIDVLEQVWEAYGKYSADQLESLTHSETPWLTAREGLRQFAPSKKKIDNNIMKEYYKQFHVE